MCKIRLTDNVNALPKKRMNKYDNNSNFFQKIQLKYIQ